MMQLTTQAHDGIAVASPAASPEFARLTPEHRARVWAWEDAMRDIDGARNKLDACQRIAAVMIHERGWSPENLRRKFYAWKRGGRDWRVLIDRAQAPAAARDCPRAIVDNLFRTYCERHQRSNRRAWQSLMFDLRRGVAFRGIGDWRDIWMACYPGERPPAACPSGWVPPGMTYRNLQRYAKPSRYELTVTRIGPKAARACVPGVYSTRAGLLPGQLYQWDDVWHDDEIVMPGQATCMVRPLELCCIDVASTNKIAYGLRPQLPREDGGPRENLSELEMLWLVCHVLVNVGVHRNGCVWCVEHGTAAVRDPVRKIIDRLTGGLIQYRDSDVIGKAIHAGMFDGTGKGNFRAKALVESSHRLLHYEAAMLPAQTGGVSRGGDRPEQLDGIERWAAHVLKAWQTLPDNLRERLFYGGLSWSGYGRVIDAIYRSIYQRTDHEIEGWDANEWTEAEWSVDGRGDWRSMREIAHLPEPMQALALEAARTPGFTRMRRWSPIEAWESGRDALTRIPFWGIADILGMERAKRVAVHANHLIEFQARELGPGDHRFAGVVECPDGRSMALSIGRPYAVWVIPYAPERALVADAASGAIIGSAPRWASVSPLDTVQVQVMQEAQGRMVAALNAPIIARHTEEADDRLAAMEHTRRLIEDHEDGARAAAPRPCAAGQTDSLLALAGKAAQEKQETQDGNEEW